jgi:PAS domain S-box-containing protein
MYGYSSQEIIGRSIDLIIPVDRTGEVDQILARIEAGESVVRLETVRVRKDGTAFPVSLTISLIRDEDGTVVGTSAIHRVSR